MRYKAVTAHLLTVTKRVMALVLCIGALPFVFSAGAYAGEKAKGNIKAKGEGLVKGEGLEAKEAKEAKEEKRDIAQWLWEDYKKPVGLTYNAQARLQASYLWRGLYAGAANIQASANVGYGGLYLDMWWNVGVTDWTFRTFQPEVDLSLGFNRWGLEVFVLYVYNFNTGFFDFGNYPNKGNRLEIDAAYTLSKKIPLKFLWSSRVAASDCFVNAAGDTVRAFSSYFELSYTHNFPLGFSLYGAVGMTPWKSIYSDFDKDFAVVNVELRARKDWSVSTRCGMMLQVQLTVNPNALATDRATARWHPYAPEGQSINANITYGVYLK